MGKNSKLGSQNDFFKRKSQQATEDLQAAVVETEDAMALYIERLGKERENFDIDLFVPAPDEWNRFPSLTPGKRAQLKMSIMNNGILDPIIAWEQADGKLMVLAGHNRLSCSREILDEYKDVELKRDYRSIPTIRYKHDELDDYKAREIIIDTNYIQRNDLPANLRAWVLKERIYLMRNQKDERGMTIDELIQDLNIKKTAVYEDVQIATQIIDPLSALYFEGKLSRKAVLKFALFTDDIQKRIFETYPDKITTERVLQLSKSMKLWESIAEVFEDVEPEIRKQMYISAPKSMAQRVRKVSKLYVEDEDFRALCDKYYAEKYAAAES